MKKIIDNKLYDTEKAELVFSFKRKVTKTSLIGKYTDWVDAELYKTKKGAWFEVIGEGRPECQLNSITDERAKEIIQIDPVKYQELYDDVEEA